MPESKTDAVEKYLEDLPEYRRETISELRNLILENLPDGYQETINWGMISYEIPLSTYPETYNNQPLSYIGLAAQQNHNALYLMAVYQDDELKEWLEDQFEEADKEMDFSRSCLHFQSLIDLPMDAITKIIAHQTPDEFIADYEETRK